MDELIRNFGVLPDYVGLGSEHPTPTQLEVGVRFELELWRVETDYQLRHAYKTIQWPATEPSEYMKFSFSRPAKGPGFSAIVLKSAALKYPTSLLNARYNDVEWMRETARKFGESIGAPVEENDWGYDY